MAVLLNRKERAVMNAVYNLVAKGAKTGGILNDEMIFREIPKVGFKKLFFEIFYMKKRAEKAGKDVLQLEEINAIMHSLATSDYFDLVVTEHKGTTAYVVNLLNRGLSFIRDERDKRKTLYLIILRTVLLAILSFVIGIVLRAIFFT